MRNLLLLAIFGITQLANAAPMAQSDIDQLIQKIQALHNSEPSLQANFREERHMAMLKDPIVNEGKVWFTLPDKIRREIGGKTPSTTVFDGKKMSIYYPNYQQVEVYDVEKRPMLKDSLRALTAGLDLRGVANFYEIEGSRDVSGYHIRLTPKTASIKKLVRNVELTIDNNLNPQSVNLEDSRGQKISETYTNVRRGSLPDSTFEFTTPPGAKVTTPLGS